MKLRKFENETANKQASLDAKRQGREEQKAALLATAPKSSGTRYLMGEEI